MLSLPEQSAWYLNSLPAAAFVVVRRLLMWVGGRAPVNAGDLASSLVGWLSLALIVLVGLKLARQLRARTDLVEVWFWFVFAWLFFAGSYFWPWYATSLVMLSALSRRPHVWVVTTVLSLSAMFVYSCANCRTYFNAPDSPLTGLLIFVPPLLTLAVLTRRDQPETSAQTPVMEGMPRYG